MTLPRVAAVLTKGAQLARDVNAVRRGRIVQRLENKLIGRVVSHVLRRVWR